MVIGLLIVVSLAIGVFGLSGTRSVRLEGAMLQQRIDAELPKEHTGVKITKVTLYLLEHDVSIALSAEGSALGQQFSLEAEGVGVPEYRSTQEAFYFRPSELAITQLTLKGESTTDRAGRFADRYITNPTLKENIETSLPGVKLWVEDNLEPRALILLGQIPLYKPKNDMSGIIIKATLAGVAIDNGALVLSFSILELTKTVFSCLFLLLISLGVAMALVRSPAWGIPLIALS